MTTSDRLRATKPCYDRVDCKCCKEVPDVLCVNVDFLYPDIAKTQPCIFEPITTYLYWDCYFGVYARPGELPEDRITAWFVRESTGLYEQESRCYLKIAWPAMGWVGDKILKLPIPNNRCCIEDWKWEIDLTPFDECCWQGVLTLDATFTGYKAVRAAPCFDLPPNTGANLDPDKYHRDLYWEFYNPETGKWEQAYVMTRRAEVQRDHLAPDASPYSHWITISEDALRVGKPAGTYYFRCKWKMPNLDPNDEVGSITDMHGRFVVDGDIVSLSINGFDMPVIQEALDAACPRGESAEDPRDLYEDWHYFIADVENFTIAGVSPPTTVFEPYPNDNTLVVAVRNRGGPVGLRMEFACPLKLVKTNPPTVWHKRNELCLPTPPNTGQPDPSDSSLDASWTVNGSKAYIAWTHSANWLPNGASPDSNWITSAPDGGYTDQPEGSYVYRAQWNIPVDPSGLDRVAFGGRFLVDGELQTLKINDQILPVSLVYPDGALCDSTDSGFTGWHYFALPPSVVSGIFKQGINTIEITVLNRKFDCGSAGPTGLRFEFYCCPDELQTAECCVAPPNTGVYLVRPVNIPESQLPRQHPENADKCQCLMDYYWTSDGGNPAWAPTEWDDVCIDRYWTPLPGSRWISLVCDPVDPMFDKIEEHTFEVEWYVSEEQLCRASNPFFYALIHADGRLTSFKVNGQEFLPRPLVPPGVPPRCLKTRSTQGLPPWIEWPVVLKIPITVLKDDDVNRIDVSVVNCDGTNDCLLYCSHWGRIGVSIAFTCCDHGPYIPLLDETRYWGLFYTGEITRTEGTGPYDSALYDVAWGNYVAGSQCADIDWYGVRFGPGFGQDWITPIKPAPDCSNMELTEDTIWTAETTFWINKRPQDVKLFGCLSVDSELLDIEINGISTGIQVLESMFLVPTWTSSLTHGIEICEGFVQGENRLKLVIKGKAGRKTGVRFAADLSLKDCQWEQQKDGSWVLVSQGDNCLQCAPPRPGDVCRHWTCCSEFSPYFTIPCDRLPPEGYPRLHRYP